MRAPSHEPNHRLLAFSLGLIYVWFGAPKLWPGASPAEDLVCATVPWFDPAWFVPALGIVEIMIGLCLWSATWRRAGLALMGLHMLGAVLPLVTLPSITWSAFGVLSLEGQYILKNTVLVAAAFVLAARGSSAVGASHRPGRSRRGPRPIGAAALDTRRDELEFRASREAPRRRTRVPAQLRASSLVLAAGQGA